MKTCVEAPELGVIVMAYIVMACVEAPDFGLHSYGLYSYGTKTCVEAPTLECSYGLHSYGLYSHGLCVEAPDSGVTPCTRHA